MNVTVTGLSTTTFVPTVTGNHKVEGKLTLPSPATGDGETAVVVTINKNGSPVYTGPTGAEGFKTVQYLLTTDTVTIVLTSGATADQVKNAIKTTITTTRGQ